MLIPAGRYRIGLTASCMETMLSSIVDTRIKPEYLAASVPRHEIIIKRFTMSDGPVTCREYRTFVDATGYQTLAEREGWGWLWEGKWLRRKGISWRGPFGTAADRDYVREEALFPAVQIAWQDAVAYCEWITARDGVCTRLPDEGEWEVFAELSGLPDSERAAGLPELPESVRRDSRKYVNALSGLARGTSGAGIVWEWTSSWYESYPGGSHYRDFGNTYRVLRGGSAASAAIQKIRQFRLRKCPTARSPYYGFRTLTGGSN